MWKKGVTRVMPQKTFTFKIQKNQNVLKILYSMCVFHKEQHLHANILLVKYFFTKLANLPISRE